MSMEKLGEAQWPIDQPGHLETQENFAMMNHPWSGHKEEMNLETLCDQQEEHDKKDQGDQQPQAEEESSLPKTIPTYAPQEPREEEADDEDEGESSTSTHLHSWCSMPMRPPYDPLESSESKSNDADDGLVDWTKEIPTEDEAVIRKAEPPKIPARSHVAFLECRRKQVAAFCERYWGPSVSQTSSPAVRQKVSSSNNFRAIPNRQYLGNQQRHNKRSFPHRFSDHFPGEESCQRNIKRGFNQRHSDNAAASIFHYHKEPHGSKDSLSNSHSKRSQNMYRPSGFSPWNHNTNDSTPFQSTI